MKRFRNGDPGGLPKRRCRFLGIPINNQVYNLLGYAPIINYGDHPKMDVASPMQTQSDPSMFGTEGARYLHVIFWNYLPDWVNPQPSNGYHKGLL